MRINITFSTNCKYRTAVTLYTQETYFVAGIYSRVSYCDGSFYDDSVLRHLSSRTERSRLVVHRCRNSSILSLLRALLALFRCACVSSFYILVQFFSVDCELSNHDVHQRDRKKNQNIWRYILSWCLLNHGLGLLQQNKKWFDWFFFSIICVYFIYLIHWIKIVCHNVKEYFQL